MRKLNNRKVRWIVREIDQGRSMSSAARVQGVSRVRVWQLYRTYQQTGVVPVLQKYGRKQNVLSKSLVTMVLEAHGQSMLGPVHLEMYIRKKHGTHVPHNTIHRILLEYSLVGENMKKKRQRKYVRWERDHSMTLWQGDWKELVLPDGRRQWIIAFMDDASRLITCHGIFDNPTTQNTIMVLPWRY